MAEQPPEVERVDKFTWQRLLNTPPHALPFGTRAVLMVLSIYMSDDGSAARPGLENLAAATGRSRSVLIDHLGAAVKKGYLAQVGRGGYRGGRGAAKAYASLYEATVPKLLYAVAVRLLEAPPWRKRRSDGSDLHSNNEGPTGRTFIEAELVNEGPVLANEGPVLANEGPTGRTPSISSINQEDINHGRPRPSDPSGSPAGAVCSTCNGKRFVVTGVGVSDYCHCHPLYEKRTAA